MIQAQPGDQPPAGEFTDQHMCDLKDRRVLHPDSGQLVDVEEAPVVDLVNRCLPVGQAIGLGIEEFVQQIKARRNADLPVELANVIFYMTVDGGRLRY